MSVRVFSRDMTIDETIPRAKREKSVTFARIIGWQLSAANMPSYCYLQTSVTSKFTKILLVTDVCQQQIHRHFPSDRRLPVANFRLFAIDRRLSIASSIIYFFSVHKKYFNEETNIMLEVTHNINN